MFGRKAKAIKALIAYNKRLGKDFIELWQETQELQRNNARLKLQVSGLKNKYKMLYSSIYGKVTPIGDSIRDERNPSVSRETIYDTNYKTGVLGEFYVAVGTQFKGYGCEFTVMRKERGQWVCKCEHGKMSHWTTESIQYAIQGNL